MVDEFQSLENITRVFDFGMGKRLCLGEVFARSRIFLFISTLMQMVNGGGSWRRFLVWLSGRDMVSGIVVISTLMQMVTVVDLEGASWSDCQMSDLLFDANGNGGGSWRRVLVWLSDRHMVPGIVIQSQPNEARFISRTR